MTTPIVGRPDWLRVKSAQHSKVAQFRVGANNPIHPFDLAEVWPHRDYPLITVGYWPI